MNENKNFDSLIWKIVWKMKKIIHMLANEFLLLQAAWSNTMTYLAVAVILSCPYIFQVDCSWMVSKNFFSICSSECMLVPGQTEFKCETAVTADTCDPLAGVNRGRVVVGSSRRFCAGPCQASSCDLFSGRDSCQLRDTATQHLTIYGEYCVSDCGLAGYDYFWCRTKTGFNSNWDYCTPSKLIFEALIS